MKRPSGIKIPSEMAPLLFGCLFVLSVFFIHGCTDNADLVLVDFSKTKTPARSEKPRQGRPLLKIAVAAMISPKETFSYYRQLFGYIGDNLDREIQIIQRKTYGEINELLA
ncbi:MAG: hypothetical protein H8D55_03235, partial [Deltaproteobacteria bacterium]|nr:hypothetical protein [Deltaproteobacteria bacterium]